jgi:WD40 repeat protein
MKIKNAVLSVALLTTLLLASLPGTGYAQVKPNISVELSHPDGIREVKVARDRQHVFTVGGGYFKIWNVWSGFLEKTFLIDSSKQANFFFTDNPVFINEALSQIYVPAADALDILDLYTGKRLGKLPGIYAPNLFNLSYDPAHQRLAYFSEADTSLHIYSLKKDTDERVVPFQHSAIPFAIAFTPDSKYLIIGGGGSKTFTNVSQDSVDNYMYRQTKPIILLNTSDWKIERILGYTHTWTTDITFNLSQHKVLIVNQDDSCRQFNYQTWKTYPSPFLRNSLKARYNEDGTRIFFANQSYINVYDSQNLALLDTLAYPFSRWSAQVSFDFLGDSNFLIAGYNTTGENLLIWDLFSKKAQTLNINLTNSNLVQFSHSGRMFVTAGNDGVLRLWDSYSGKMIRRLIFHQALIRAVAFDKKDRQLVSVDENDKIAVWDLKTYALKHAFYEGGNFIRWLDFGPDTHYFYTDDYDGSVKIWNVGKNKAVGQLEHIFGSNVMKNYGGGPFLIDRDGIMYIGGSDGILRKFKIGVGPKPTSVSSLKLSNDMISSVNLSDGYILVSDGKRLYQVEQQPLKLLDSISLPSAFVKIVTDGNSARFLLLDGQSISLYNHFKTQAPLQTFYQGGNFSAAAFHPVSGFLTTGALDAVQLWDNHLQKKLELFSVFNSPDYFSVTPEGVYATTSGAISGIRFHYQDNFFLLEQFDYLLNRPDEVLRAWPGADSVQVAQYKHARADRLADLGIPSTPLNMDFNDVPELSLEMENTLPYTTEKSMEINMHATARKSDMKEIIVWVNNVPAGKFDLTSDSNANKRDIIKKTRIWLSPGVNVISARVTNIKLVSSPIRQIRIYGKAAYPKPDLYLITLGIDSFSQPHISGLKFAEKDADDINRLFYADSDYYHHVYSLKLRGRLGNAKNLDIKTIKQFLSVGKIQDNVIFFISSHGFTYKGQNYIALQNTSLESPETTAVLIDSLENILSGAPARNRVVFLDACHSGKNDINDLLEKKQERENPPGYTRNLKALPGYRKDPDYAFLLMETTFQDVERKSGITVLSAAGGEQVAQENKTWKNGAFTKTLIKGINDLRVTPDGVRLKELSSYIMKHISELNVQQNPVFRSENLVNDFRIF